jgi:hypothetical protein
MGNHDEDNAVSADPATEPLLVRPDPLLETLLRMADIGASATVTLLVGGHRIAGEIINFAGFMKEFANLVATGLERATASPENAEKIRGAGAAAAEKFSGNDVKAHNYIHLRNVRILGGAGVAAQFNDSPMRIRLSSVDGWHLGAPGWVDA